MIDFVDLSLEDRIYLLGDLNMPTVSWLPDDDDRDWSSNGFSIGYDRESNVLLPRGVDSSAHADLLYCLMGNGFSQVNDVPNYQGRILDLVFCNDLGEVTVSKALSDRD